MTGEELRNALKEGRRVYGTAILSPSPRWLEGIVRTGLDFVFIDTEHIPIDRHQLSWMCRAYRALNIAPIVRVPSPDPYQACMALDGGAVGLIYPYVESPDEVLTLQEAVRLRPLKGKQAHEVSSGQAQLSPKLKRYLDNFNRHNVLIVNIESRAAMDVLDDILEVDGLDAVLIGPHDLSISLGIPEEYGHPDFDAAVREIIGKARARNIGAGIHFSSGFEPQVEWARAGSNLIINSSDIKLFMDTIGSQTREMRRLLDGTETAEDASSGEDAI